MEELDIFWGRCDPQVVASGPFRSHAPHWRGDNTCSYCGGIRPSIALQKIKEGAKVTPTDKNYKMYVEGVGNPANKCYFNHFSQSQAVELVLLWINKKINFAVPGTFYSGLCFLRYKDAIEAAKKENDASQHTGTLSGSEET